MKEVRQMLLFILLLAQETPCTIVLWVPCSASEAAGTDLCWRQDPGPAAGDVMGAGAKRTHPAALRGSEASGFYPVAPLTKWLGFICCNHKGCPISPRGWGGASASCLPLLALGHFLTPLGLSSQESWHGLAGRRRALSSWGISSSPPVRCRGLEPRV